MLLVSAQSKVTSRWTGLPAGPRHEVATPSPYTAGGPPGDGGKRQVAEDTRFELVRV
jgi:hypothetical protein